MNTLAKRVRYARDRLHLSQEKLAELSGLKQSDISKIETSRILRTTGIVSLSKALRCSPDWLESGEGHPLWDGASNVDEGPAVRGEVPLISWVQAGSWNGAEDPLAPGDAERWLPCPARHGLAH
jgi:transcriptional regulator with XRE-family HTH domain